MRVHESPQLGQVSAFPTCFFPLRSLPWQPCPPPQHCVSQSSPAGSACSEPPRPVKQSFVSFKSFKANLNIVQLDFAAFGFVPIDQWC